MCTRAYCSHSHSISCCRCSGVSPSGRHRGLIAGFNATRTRPDSSKVQKYGIIAAPESSDRVGIPRGKVTSPPP